MSETEEAKDEETLAEDELAFESTDLDDYGTYLENLILSFTRQLICFCCVFMFPIVFTLFNTLLIRVKVPERYEFRITPDTIDKVKTDRENYIAYERDILLASSPALIISAILLYFFGRKYTVVMANLLHLVVLLYCYVANFEGDIPYHVWMGQIFVKDFSLVPYLIYVAEVASPGFRVFFMGLFWLEATAVERGMVTALIEKRINEMIRNCAIGTGFSLLLTVIMPETPFFVMLRGDVEKAEETFSWLRAGNTNAVEFDQMIARAENITDDNGFMPHLFSRTFIWGLIFSCFIVLYSFSPCQMLETFVHDFYVAEKSTDRITREEVDGFTTAVVLSGKDSDSYLRFYASALFLAFSIVVPRKIILLVTYVLRALILAMVSLKLAPYKTLVKIISYCNIAPTWGLVQLLMILPAEIYPATLREFGVTFSILLSLIDNFFFYLFLKNAEKDIRIAGINRLMVYTNSFGSIFGVLFMLIFMPETKGMNIYQIDELKLNIPFMSREDWPVDEELDVEEEGE